MARIGIAGPGGSVIAQYRGYQLTQRSGEDPQHAHPPRWGQQWQHQRGDRGGHLIGGLAGAIAIVVLLLAAATAMYLRSRRAPVDHTNVNDEWTDRRTNERVPAGVGN